jgi:hypothetical protein
MRTRLKFFSDSNLQQMRYILEDANQNFSVDPAHDTITVLDLPDSLADTARDLGADVEPYLV